MIITIRIIIIVSNGGFEFVKTFEQLGSLVNLHTLRLEFGGEATDNGLCGALKKLKK